MRKVSLYVMTSFGKAAGSPQVNRMRKVSLHAMTSFHWFSAYEISIFCNLVWWRFTCSIVLKMYVVFYSTLHSEMMAQVHERQGLFILQSASPVVAAALATQEHQHPWSVLVYFSWHQHRKDEETKCFNIAQTSISINPLWPSDAIWQRQHVV